MVINKKSGYQSSVTNQAMNVDNVELDSKQNRFKSKYTWLAVLSLLMFILGHYGLYEQLGIDEVWLTTLFDLVWAVLVSIGVVNNPTDRQNW